MLLAVDADASPVGLELFLGFLLCVSVVLFLGIPLVRVLRGPKSRRPRLYGQGRRPGGRS